MKKILVVPALLALVSLPTLSHASDLRMTVERPHFTCEGRHTLLSHVAYVPGATSAEDARPLDDAPLPCCDGQIGCAQFLSTNTVIHPDRPQRG